MLSGEPWGLRTGWAAALAGTTLARSAEADASPAAVEESGPISRVLCPRGNRAVVIRLGRPVARSPRGGLPGSYQRATGAARQPLGAPAKLVL
jgi:hypothetical protein